MIAFWVDEEAHVGVEVAGCFADGADIWKGVSVVGIDGLEIDSTIIPALLPFLGSVESGGSRHLGLLMLAGLRYFLGYYLSQSIVGLTVVYDNGVHSAPTSKHEVIFIKFDFERWRIY